MCVCVCVCVYLFSQFEIMTSFVCINFHKLADKFSKFRKFAKLLLVKISLQKLVKLQVFAKSLAAIFQTLCKTFKA